MFVRSLTLAVAILTVVPAFAKADVEGQSTLEHVRAAGILSCGVVANPEDWNKTDLHGPLGPLDIEICKAVAVAVLGAKAKVDVKPYPSELEAEEKLNQRAVDLVVGVTPDAIAMGQANLVFGPAIFYDGLGILVRGDRPVKTLEDLTGLNVCVVEGTDNEKIFQARTVARGIKVKIDAFQEEGEMDDALAVRHCDAMAADLSRLVNLKQIRSRQLGRDQILPDLLTLSPVAPAYRRDDAQWGMIVDWTVYSLIQAEASGVTRANVADQASSEDPVVQRLIGVDWATSRALGLSAKDWAAQVIATVGNYGEIYDRTVGPNSPLSMPRGQNALWLNGGLMHPLPVQ